MTAPHGRGLLRLAAALDQQAAFDAASYVGPAQLAERGGLDFVTLGDASARPGPTRSPCSPVSRPPPAG